MTTAILLIAAGCGSDGNGTEAAPTGEATAAPTATPEPVLELVDLVWTSEVDERSGEPGDEVETFTTVSPSIIAAVEATDVPAGTEFTAEWTIDGLEVPDATMNVTVEDNMSTAWISFEFIREEGRYFPLGELEVTVTSSSGESIDGSVSIELP